MTLTRWKLLAGLLGLSMGGVAATADPPCRMTAAGPPCPTPCPVVSPPVVVGVPVVAAPTNPAPRPARAEAPPAPPVAENKGVEPAKLPPPAVELPVPVPTAEIPQPVTTEGPASLSLPPVTPAAAATPELRTPITPALEPAPPVSEPTPPPMIVSEPPAPQRLDPPAVPKQTPPTETEATATPGTIRVVINLGAGSPRFEVLTGDDTLLRVVSEKVDVTSPSERGEVMSALKASGSVRFCAPGCEGVCNELTVRPGSGDVELAGDVRVKCKQGKGETEIVASKMTFKLGSAPAYTVPEPAAIVTTSFPKPTR